MKSKIVPLVAVFERFGREVKYLAHNGLLRQIGLLKSRNHDVGNNIIIAGSPRGGSTWLAEVLNTIPETSIIWEPFNLGHVPRVSWRKKVPEFAALGLGWRPYIAPDEEAAPVEAFLREVLTGRLLNWSLASHSNLRQIVRSNRWIVKFCRANRLLKWMTNRFPSQEYILLIRHPCAVVASQIVNRNWANVKTPHVDHRLLAAYPHMGSILEKLETWEEALAATWCMDYWTPLSQQQPHPWILLTYEKLVREGAIELERIFGELDLEMPARAAERLGVPSAVTSADSPVVAGGDPLASWRWRLSAQQIRRVLDVVSALGLDFYDEELEPDYARLCACPGSIRATEFEGNCLR